ncbi:MAG: citrate transporter [Oscillospiraceae bacterium]|nr:citrate transporter [Oscillospiraceae bacterium]
MEREVPILNEKKSFALWAFFKKEPVLVISALCALLSMLLVPPSAAYLDYIDWKVLALLFCLMSVVAGVQECGLFDRLGQQLLSRCTGMRLLRLVLVLLPFFTSMLITNDVALITFVPFAISVLGLVGRLDECIFVVVLQTVAANLGSMATPVGNPQSLFLYNYYGLTAGRFFWWMLPLAGLSLVGLAAAALAGKDRPISVRFEQTAALKNARLLGLFAVLFVVCMLCVLHVVDYRLMLAVVLAALLVFDRPLIAKVDYSLLLTFVCFFVFSGNLGGMEAVRSLLTDLLERSTLFTSILASQVVSNVPAAVLLAGFTSDARGMLMGTNVGGLGTIIASLASLISFKYYLRSPGANAGRYMAVFTAVNLIGLAALTAAACLL